MLRLLASALIFLLVYGTHSGHQKDERTPEQLWAEFNANFTGESTDPLPNNGRYRYKTRGDEWDNYTTMSGIVVQPVGHVALSTSGQTCLPVIFSLEEIISANALRNIIAPIFQDFEDKYKAFKGEKCKVSYGHLMYTYTTESLNYNGKYMEEVLTKTLDSYIGVYEGTRRKRNAIAAGLGQEGAEFAIYGAFGLGTTLYELVQEYWGNQLKGELLDKVEEIGTNVELHDYEIEMDEFIEDCRKILLKKAKKILRMLFVTRRATLDLFGSQEEANRAMEALLSGHYNDSIYNTHKKFALELVTVRPLRRASVYEIEAEMCAPIILNENINTLVQVADIGKFGSANNYYYSVLPPYIVDDGPQQSTYSVNMKSCISIGTVRVCNKFDRLEKDCNLQTQTGCPIINKRLTDEFYWKRRVKDIAIVATNSKMELKYGNSTRPINPAGNKIVKAVELTERSELHVGRTVVYGKSSDHFVHKIASEALDSHRIYSQLNGTLYEDLDLMEEGLYRPAEMRRQKKIVKWWIIALIILAIGGVPFIIFVLYLYKGIEFERLWGKFKASTESTFKNLSEKLVKTQKTEEALERKYKMYNERRQ